MNNARNKQRPTKHRPITERDIKRVLTPIVESVLNEKPIRGQSKKSLDVVRPIVESTLGEAPNSNLDQLFAKWLNETAKTTKTRPSVIASSVAKYVRRDYPTKPR